MLYRQQIIDTENHLISLNQSAMLTPQGNTLLPKVIPYDSLHSSADLHNSLYAHQCQVRNLLAVYTYGCMLYLNVGLRID